MIEKPDMETVPNAPGVYVFRDSQGEPIYVGKAKSLRNRLASYFQGPAGGDYKTVSMLDEAASVDWTVASTEAEAILLEYNLIQEFRPRFNIKLKDDKSFPYLVVTFSEEWPRVFVGRGRPKKGNRYLGPFARAHALRETLDLLRKAFPIRTCSDVQFEEHRMLGRPCLYHDIHLCVGPCIGAVGREEYRKLVSEFCKAAGGGHRRIERELEKLMWEAAEQEEFEKAALYRNRLEALRGVAERQQVLSAASATFDVVGIARDELGCRVEVFRVKEGALKARYGYSVDLEREAPDEELVGEVLMELYGAARGGAGRLGEHTVAGQDDTVYADGTRLPGGVPGEILVSVLPPDSSVLEEFLSSLRGLPVRIRLPKKGDRRRLVELAVQNASEALQRMRLERAMDHNARSRALVELQEALGLPEAPLRIECFDISNTGPTEVVGSMVVFEDGLPRPQAYRKFKVKSVHGQDDFASMREVVSRRLARLDEDARSRGTRYRPGLLLVDGGPGQLSAALAALAERGIGDIPVAALAKRFEELYVPGRRAPVVLKRGSEALFLIQRIRDEAHRVALSYHRKRREKSVRRSVLEDVPGVGPRRAKRLLETFGSLDAMRAVPPTELAERCGIPRKVADAVGAYLGGELPSQETKGARSTAERGPDGNTTSTRETESPRSSGDRP